MFDNLNIPSIDIDLSTEGKWFEYGDTGIAFKIARNGNPQHKRALMGKANQIKKLTEKGDFNRANRINDEMIAQFILKDWRGVKNANKSVDYTVDNGIALLTDPRYEDVANFIADCSHEYAEYEAQETEELVKN